MSLPTTISSRVKTYFNKQSIISPLLRHERRALARSGAYVAEVARRSMHKKRGSSKPGNPPHSHTGKLRRMIGSGVDSNAVCAVAGAILRHDVTNDGNTPHNLEYGGKNKIKVFNRKLKIGDVAPIKIGSSDGRMVKNYEGRTVKVTEIKIKTQEQLRKANQIQKTISGRNEIEVVIAPRPYMKSALIQSEKYIERFFKE